MSKPCLSAIERLMVFAIALLIILHIFACIFVCLGKDPASWIPAKSSMLSGTNDGTLYLAAIYWAMTTFATVGYGDISGVTTEDFIFTMIVFVSFLSNIYLAFGCLHVLISLG